MKALEKDRSRRYETAMGLAADIDRYLADEPVLACPPSAVYRLRKFVRRNKGPVVAVSLVLLALVAGMIGTTWGLVRADNAYRDAVAAQLAEAERAEGERRAKDEAQAREAESQAVLDFVENKVFAAARPEGQMGGMGHDVTLRRAIEAALPFVETSFTDQPLIEARLRMTLGTSFRYLGEAKIAAEQYEKARALYTKHLGGDHGDTLRSMTGLANSYHDLGRGADALNLLEATLALMKAKLGPDHRDTLVCMNTLAHSYVDHGRGADALNLLEATLALMKAKLGPDHPDTLGCMSNLAFDYAAVGRGGDALKLQEETLRRAKLGPDHPDTLSSMYSLANTVNAFGRRAEAIKLHEEVLMVRKKTLGVDHPATLRSLDFVACWYTNFGRNADALKLHEERLTLLKAKLGADHPDTLDCMRKIGSCYQNLGRYAEALKLQEQTLALRKLRLGPDHSDTLDSMSRVARCLVELDRDPAAIVDECLGRVSGKVVDPQLITRLGVARLRHFQKAKDAAGCRATAEMFEKLKSPDAIGLYDRACYRAVTAAVIRANDKSEIAAKLAAAEADQAMAWLKQAAAAGFNDTKLMKTDKDLDALRDREDFKKLLVDLEMEKQKQKQKK